MSGNASHSSQQPSHFVALYALPEVQTGTGLIAPQLISGMAPSPALALAPYTHAPPHAPLAYVISPYPIASPNVNHHSGVSCAYVHDPSHGTLGSPAERDSGYTTQLYTCAPTGAPGRALGLPPAIFTIPNIVRTEFARAPSCEEGVYQHCALPFTPAAYGCGEAHVSKCGIDKGSGNTGSNEEGPAYGVGHGYPCDELGGSPQGMFMDPAQTTLGHAFMLVKPSNMVQGENSGSEPPLIRPLPYHAQSGGCGESILCHEAVPQWGPAHTGEPRCWLPAEDGSGENSGGGPAPRRRGARLPSAPAVPSRGTARLFVGQLPASATMADLELIFSCYGRVLQVKIQRESGPWANRGGSKRDRSTSTPVGRPGALRDRRKRRTGAEQVDGGEGGAGCYAFVTYESMIEADAAIAALHGKYILAEAPPPQPPQPTALIDERGTPGGLPGDGRATPIAPQTLPHVAAAPGGVLLGPAHARGAPQWGSGGTVAETSRGAHPLTARWDGAGASGAADDRGGWTTHPTRSPPRRRCRGSRPLQVSYTQTTTNLSNYGYAHALALHRSNANNPVPMKAGSPTHYAWKSKTRVFKPPTAGQ